MRHWVQRETRIGVGSSRVAGRRVIQACANTRVAADIRRWGTARQQHPEWHHHKPEENCSHGAWCACSTTVEINHSLVPIPPESNQNGNLYNQNVRTTNKSNVRVQTVRQAVRAYYQTSVTLGIVQNQVRVQVKHHINSAATGGN